MRFFTCVVLCFQLGHIGCSSLIDHAIYLGCFSGINQLHQKGHLIHPFVAENCLKVCSGNGHRHAGLDSINSMCYCGTDFLNQTNKAENSLCKPCKDDSKLICGGVLKVSLYEIEVNMLIDNLTNGHHEIESKFEEETMILLAGHEGIYSYNTSTNDLKTIIRVDYHSIDAIDYHLRRKEGFGIWNEMLFRFPLFEDHPLIEYNAEVMRDVNRCPTFAVDWVHNKLYWPDCYRHCINAIDLSSNSSDRQHYTEDTILHLRVEGAWALDMAVDPYKGLLFWTSGASLWSCRLDGRGLRKVISEFPVNRVSSLSIDLRTERVYFSGLDKHDKESSKLYYTSYNGSISHSLQFHEYEGGSHVLSFGVFNHYMYFLKSIDSNSSVVMTSKLEYNHRPTILTLGKDIQAKLLKLVHPKLQSPGKEDVCTNHGCSHLCVIEGSLPRCYCPLYYELDHDNKTCFVGYGDDDEPLLVRIVFGLMLVLIAVLGAGVLMCLCDKLWSQLHPKMVRLSVPGVAKTTFTGQRMQDGENLI